MSVAVITGSAGLVGSEAVRYFASLGLEVIGIDNDMRATFFGSEASTISSRQRLEREVRGYRHFDVDIRDQAKIFDIFQHAGAGIDLVIHTAAQPSHDWAAQEPFTDFSVNAQGTLVMLEAVRRYAPDSAFIFTSTNKVYGDRPNTLPLVELKDRWEIAPGHEYERGIPEEFPIDRSMHSLFGASKVSADLLVQEYGRYFGIKTVCFRGGCLTGPNHAGTQLHGFLAYLMKCAVTGRPYTVFGYQGKQVRDNIHSADLIRAFHEFYKAPRVAEVYNIGGGRFSNCSMLEAIALCQAITGQPMTWSYADANRKGDHIWWISGLERFTQHFPDWRLEYDVPHILREMYEVNAAAWRAESTSS